MSARVGLAERESEHERDERELGELRVEKTLFCPNAGQKSVYN